MRDLRGTGETMATVLRTLGAAALAGTLLAACGSSSGTAAGQDTPGSSWLIQTSADTVAGATSPGTSWTRMQPPQLTSLVGSDVTSEQVGTAGAPVVAIRNNEGSVVLLLSGWTATGRTTADEQTLCAQAGSWLAKAQDTYGLVPAGEFDPAADCRQVTPQPDPAAPADTLAMNCAPAVSNTPSTCAGISAQRLPSGELQVSATLMAQ